jgi:predicted O-methyltransferase YrrM
MARVHDATRTLSWHASEKERMNMTGIPRLPADLSHLHLICMGDVSTRVLMTGIELELFDHLSTPRSAADVAPALGLHVKNTGHLLDALTALGLLHKEGGNYQNTSATEASLVTGKATYVGASLVNEARWKEDVLKNMPRIVRDGPLPAQDDIASGELWAEMAAHQVGEQLGGAGPRAARIVQALPEFPRMKKMLDLGGGAGLIGSSIVSAHPTMCGVLFDRPEVIRVARQFLAAYGMEERMTTIGGDYAKDPIGDGYDLVWASFTLNFFRGQLAPILRKIYASLMPGGVFVSCADGLTHERTQPPMMVLSMVTTALAGSDMCFDQGEIAEGMLEAGFRTVHSRTVETSYGPVDVDVARKAV